jgi:ammonium transporter Rh
MIEAEFGAASVLISMGAILGKCSLFQLFGMTNINVFFYTLNRFIVFNIFKATDIGESMTINVFGAYFGVITSWFYQPKQAIEDKHELGKSNYLSDLVSMTGTLFLFIYWPSFNGARTHGSNQMRAVINTYLSLSSSVIASIIVSRITKGKKLEMEIILNASLAGGVVMGCNANIIAMSFGAMLAGFIAGTVSSLGYAFLEPYLAKKINLHDTCGVHNLNGMPGVIGGITSAIVISRGWTNFGDNYAKNFFDPTMRTASQQAGFQLAALATSLAFGLFGGLISGLITGNHNPFFEPLPVDHFFDDTYAWDECEIDHRILYNLQ